MVEGETYSLENGRQKKYVLKYYQRHLVFSFLKFATDNNKLN